MGFDYNVLGFDLFSTVRDVGYDLFLEYGTHTVVAGLSLGCRWVVRYDVVSAGRQEFFGTWSRIGVERHSPLTKRNAAIIHQRSDQKKNTSLTKKH